MGNPRPQKPAATKPAATTPDTAATTPDAPPPAPLFAVSPACLRHCARLIHEDATVSGEAGRDVCREMVLLAGHMRDLADALPIVAGVAPEVP